MTTPDEEILEDQKLVEQTPLEQIKGLLANIQTGIATLSDEDAELIGNLKNKGHTIYTYANIDGIPNYSLLAQYYDPNDNQLYDGIEDPKLGLGYYNADIPYGYDEDNPQINEIDFTDKGWASYGDPYCEIKRWANINNIQWDGLLNYNKC